jgi:hypothetical protein
MRPIRISLGLFPRKTELRRSSAIGGGYCHGASLDGVFRRSYRLLLSMKSARTLRSKASKDADSFAVLRFTPPWMVVTWRGSEVGVVCGVVMRLCREARWGGSEPRLCSATTWRGAPRSRECYKGPSLPLCCLFSFSSLLNLRMSI